MTVKCDMIIFYVNIVKYNNYEENYIYVFIILFILNTYIQYNIIQWHDRTSSNIEWFSHIIIKCDMKILYGNNGINNNYEKYIWMCLLC